MIPLDTLLNYYIKKYGKYGIPSDFWNVMLGVGGISNGGGVVRLVGADVYVCDVTDGYVNMGGGVIMGGKKSCEIIEVYFANKTHSVSIHNEGFGFRGEDGFKRECAYPSGAIVTACGNMIREAYPAWESLVQDIHGVGAVLFQEDGSIKI